MFLLPMEAVCEKGTILFLNHGCCQLSTTALWTKKEKWAKVFSSSICYPRKNQIFWSGKIIWYLHCQTLLLQFEAAILFCKSENCSSYEMKAKTTERWSAVDAQSFNPLKITCLFFFWFLLFQTKQLPTEMVLTINHILPLINNGDYTPVDHKLYLGRTP